MADNAWSQSGCDGSVWWYGVPGAGCYYWTERYGQYWVGGGIYQKYASAGYECGALGPPVKEYQWLSEFAAYGQWFLGGAIYYSNGAWRMVLGQYGQTTGRMDADQWDTPPNTEEPPDAPVEPENRPDPPQ